MFPDNENWDREETGHIPSNYFLFLVKQSFKYFHEISVGAVFTKPNSAVKKVILPLKQRASNALKFYICPGVLAEFEYFGWNV